MKAMREQYHRRRDLIVRRLNESASMPSAARFVLRVPVGGGCRMNEKDSPRLLQPNASPWSPAPPSARTAPASARVLRTGYEAAHRSREPDRALRAEAETLIVGSPVKSTLVKLPVDL